MPCAHAFEIMYTNVRIFRYCIFIPAMRDNAGSILYVTLNVCLFNKNYAGATAGKTESTQTTVTPLGQFLTVLSSQASKQNLRSCCTDVHKRAIFNFDIHAQLAKEFIHAECEPELSSIKVL